MIAILGGLGAGLCWSMTGLCGQRASRVLGELVTFAWGAAIGALVAIVPAVISVIESPPSASAALALGFGGILNAGGLLCQFSALRRGRVSVVIAITSSEGAIAGLVAVAAGAHLPLAGWLGLAAVLTGIAVTVVTQRTSVSAQDGDGGPIAVVLAVAAALAFGGGLFLQGHGGAHAPLSLAVIPPSLAGTLLVTVPLAARGRLPAPRGVGRWVVGFAAVELAGFASYVIGARHSVPIAAVLSTQYATISVAVGVLVLRERFTRGQLTGFLLTIVGVTLLAALS